MSDWHGLARRAAAAALLLAAAACGRSHDAPAGADGGVPPDGGSATDAGSARDAGTRRDAGPARDAGTARDAGRPPSECDGVGGPARCLGTDGCVPLYDDSCCPSCTPGPCADCIDYDFIECLPRGEACPTPSCGLTTSGACEGTVPDCSGAHAISLDSCDIAGCVPSYPSGEGAPSLSEAECVAIRAESCVALCLSLPPPCPDGTVAEEDGSCHTGRCIPAWVCAP